MVLSAYAAGPERGSRASERPASNRATIRVDSNLVLVPVRVTDFKDRPVTGLTRDSFRLYDEKCERPVLQLSAQDVPVSIGIVFDHSRSMTSKLGLARTAVTEFLQNGNPEDEYFLVPFSDHPELVVPFTSNPGDIGNSLLGIFAEGRTALVDAVYLALDAMKDATHSRKALLVISDGGDNDSRYSEGELRRRLREADVSIYAIGIYQQTTVILPEEEQGGPQLLSTLADDSGGRHFPLTNLSNLSRTAASISQALRDEYLLGYQPDTSRNDGKYHRLSVKVVGHGKLHVTARPGYYAARDVP